ncbi:MAG: ABC transporter substrate-binding protein [Actinobacteria bacterium]|nr:ABC transporter substrate-binding protein [Actinomycetota bacterium]
MRFLSRRRVAVAATLVAALLGLAACGGSSGKASAGTANVTLRLGYLPNLTHATALVGVQEGIYARDLGPNVSLKTATFNAGPDAVQALFSGAIDASYLGPNPAINAWQKSKGTAIKVVSGEASGGAFLVVKSSITSAAQLKGKKIASPQLGNTQDVALRSWLKSQGYSTTTEGGGEVTVVPQDNSLTLQAFLTGSIDGAWVPEPWATRLVKEGNGHVLVDERSLWPGGRYVTTLLAVRTAFLKAHPDVVQRLVQAQVDANDALNADVTRAAGVANTAIGAITGKALKTDVVNTAMANLTFTDDPVGSSLAQSAKNAEALGLLQPVNLQGIFDLSFLNQALKAKNEPQIPEPQVSGT